MSASQRTVLSLRREKDDMEARLVEVTAASRASSSMEGEVQQLRSRVEAADRMLLQQRQVSPARCLAGP